MACWPDRGLSCLDWTPPASCCLERLWKKLLVGEKKRLHGCNYYLSWNPDPWRWFPSALLEGKASILLTFTQFCSEPPKRPENITLPFFPLSSLTVHIYLLLRTRSKTLSILPSPPPESFFRQECHKSSISSSLWETSSVSPMSLKVINMHLHILVHFGNFCLRCWKWTWWKAPSWSRFHPGVRRHGTGAQLVAPRPGFIP